MKTYNLLEVKRHNGEDSKDHERIGKRYTIRQYNIGKYIYFYEEEGEGTGFVTSPLQWYKTVGECLHLETMNGVYVLEEVVLH